MQSSSILLQNWFKNERIPHPIRLNLPTLIYWTGRTINSLSNIYIVLNIMSLTFKWTCFPLQIIMLLCCRVLTEIIYYESSSTWS